MPAEVNATWLGGARYSAAGTGGHTVLMDAPLGRPEWQGFKPSELLLASLIGCTGVDFAGILVKQKQPVRRIEARATGEQDADPPWAFRSIELVFTVYGGPDLSREGAERALELAATRYCSVGATLAKAIPIRHRVEIVEEREPV